MLDEEVNGEVKLMRQKANHFFQQNKSIHIKYKKGFWKRGKILQILNDFFIIDEFMEGRKSVFFLEIYDIEEYHSNDQKIGEENGK